MHVSSSFMYTFFSGYNFYVYGAEYSKRSSISSSTSLRKRANLALFLEDLLEHFVEQILEQFLEEQSEVCGFARGRGARFEDFLEEMLEEMLERLLYLASHSIILSR